MIEKKDFTYETKCKGKIYGSYKVKNNSNYSVFYKGKFIGEVSCKRDALDFIANLVKHQKLEYTA